ncbi:MAG TPA: tetratricopeptide repeat protein [Paracoccaceae bacterium]|nr:tetratricopeptide repeat protein [Paracoccaceae bacterium]HMO70480.1 tetratricopeptide repeat protein [Paracoccaceae bacterium]
MKLRRSALSLVLAGAAALGLPSPVAAQGDAGAYLAARIAGSRDDHREAAGWFTRALLADPTNTTLMEGAIIAHMGAGNLDAAVAVARRLEQQGGTAQVGHLALIADQVKREDYEALLADLSAGRSVGRLLDALATAWGHLGAGRSERAIAGFDELAGQPGLQAFGLYHKALALASAGDFEGADDILSGRAAGEVRLMRRGVVAHAQILSQLERNEDALAVLERSFPGTNDPATDRLKDALRTGEMLPYTAARNAAEGMAEVFFTLAAALNGEASDGYTLLYARIAAWLRPDHSEAVLLAASLLESQRNYGLAVETYARITPENGSFFAAEIGRARALQADGRAEAAVEALRGLARSHGDLLGVHVALGDALRRSQRWEEAAAAYDVAVERAGPPQPEHWSLYYYRGIAHERGDVWPEAEADFQQALALNPDQPQVLNYLGYSWIDRGERLDEALAMIERAVAAQPDAGYIIDSLAWGLFRLGRYEEALEPMERASVLEPVDPVVTDHLGDVYWAVGRQMEARFQWRRALSFDPEEKDALRIRRKLEVGLDAVLREEGAPPLRPVDAARAGN